MTNINSLCKAKQCAFRATPLLLLPLVFALGCSADFGKAPATSNSTVTLGTITGSVQGGQQPVVGSVINVYAASSTGYGAASTLLTPVPVVTGAGGQFSITGTYTCTAGQQVYMTAMGGDPSGNGLGVNSAIGLMGVLGTCPQSGTFATTLPHVLINEVSTVAAAYALAPFATDVTHVSSSGTTAATTGVANAFGNAAKFFDITGASGQGSLSQLPGSTSSVRALPSEAIVDMVANILASCVNSEPTGVTPSSACSTLLSAATSDGTTSGTAPTETATAAINIAHHPAANVATLFGLISSTPPFAPAGYQFPYQPIDFSLFVVYYSDNALQNPMSIAVDAGGNAWVDKVEITPAGTIVNGQNGFNFPNGGIALSGSGNVWTTTYLGTAANEYTSTGTQIASYTASSPLLTQAVALDSQGQVWISESGRTTQNVYANHLTILHPTGSVLSEIDLTAYNQGVAAMNFDNLGFCWMVTSKAVLKLDASGNVQAQFPISNTVASGYNSPIGVALDSTGNAWVSDLADNSIVKLNSSGTALAPVGGVTGGGIVKPMGVAVDGAGQVWAADNASFGGITELSNSGTILSGTYGYRGAATLISGSPAGGVTYPQALALDGSGDVWVTANGDAIYGNGSTGGVVEFIGIAAPVVTPLTTSVANRMVGMRP